MVLVDDEVDGCLGFSGRAYALEGFIAPLGPGSRGRREGEKSEGEM